MRLITEEKLRKKEYLDCELVGDKILIFKNNTKIGEVEADNRSISAFNNRRPKLAIKEIEGDGSYSLVLVRWFDLHGHTVYSLLDGAVKIKDKAKKTEYVAAITDHGNMFGMVKFYKEMEKEGKHAVIGTEAYAETIDGEKKSNHLILLVKNEIGYRNLLKLTHHSYSNFYHKPHISYEYLKKYSEGLVVTSACLGGEVQRAILKGDIDLAREVALWYKGVFKDDYYLEIQRHQMGRDEDIVNRGLIKLSKELDIKLVVGIDSHYVNAEDREVQEILLCLQTGKKISDEDRITFDGGGYHIHTADEVDLLFLDIPEAIDNTLEIAAKCEFELEMGNVKLPHFEVPEGHNEETYLEELVMKGFERLFENKSENQRNQLLAQVKYELKVVNDMGYPGYFLIVEDFIRYGKDNGIYIGPGRGSAVGSLIAYCLDIIELNPLDYDLLFERFLNPERVSLPDIDIDFCNERREEIIDYIKNKYGHDSVSKIVTFQTMAARSVVRDVARVLEYPYSLGDQIAKSIPEAPGMTISKAFEESPEFNEIYDEDEDAKRIIDIAVKLEGTPKNTSTHACGTVISPGPVSDHIPTFMVENDDGVKEIVSQVVMGEVEDLGLLKMDILGLKTLTAMDSAIKLAKNIDYYDIPLNDPYVYETIGKGKTYGVFQLESKGMRTFMSQLYADVPKKIRIIEDKYNCRGFTYIEKKNESIDEYMNEMVSLGDELFERLIAGLSLYRPGPMDFIPNYIEGIRDPLTVSYLHPMLEPILRTTYGVIIFQEQVMRIVQDLGGFSLGQADLLRRAMGKKQSDEVMNEHKRRFIHGEVNDKGKVIFKGCIRNGVPEKVAEAIWRQMEDFNKYAFNKSHSAGYAYIAIKTGWLSHYHNLQLMTGTLNAYILESNKLKRYLNACHELNIPISPPNVNRSKEDFSISDDKILLGLKGISGIKAVGDKIVNERDKRGAFSDLQGFVERMSVYETVDKKTLERLIYSGAVDEFKNTRASHLQVIPLLLDHGKKEKKDFDSGQINIFNMMNDVEFTKISIPEIEELDRRTFLEKEREFTGFYITAHPLDDYVQYYKDEEIREITGIIGAGLGEDDVENEYERIEEISISSGTKVNIAGIIREPKRIYTKRNQVMMKFQIEDRTGAIDGVIFPKQFEKVGYSISEGSTLLIEGTFDESSFGKQIIVNSVVDLDKVVRAEKQKELESIEIYAINSNQLTELNNVINENKGSTPIYIKIDGSKLKSNSGIELSVPIMMKIQRIFGASSVNLVSQGVVA